MLDIRGDKAASIVDAVLAICEALDDEVSPCDLEALFRRALKGGRQFAAVKMAMVAHALAQCEDTEVADD